MAPPAEPAGSIDITRASPIAGSRCATPTRSIVFSRVLKAGETYQVPRAGLILRTGNAGALAMLVDGKPAPSIGALGTLRRNVTLDRRRCCAGTAVQAAERRGRYRRRLFSVTEPFYIRSRSTIARG